jgi:uncharacterized membrane protein SirB2
MATWWPFIGTNGEKVAWILFVVLSWLVMGTQRRRDKQNYASFCIIMGCVAVIMFIGDLGVKLQMHGS